MKITNILKSIILTGIITIMTVIPVVADSQPTNQIQKDKQIADHYIMENNDVKTIYIDGSYCINSDVEIESIDYLDNSITIQKENNLYKFYVDEPRNYYLNERINITMNQNNEIIDCIVDSEPQVYNTTISQIQDDTAFLIANGNKYLFENTEGSDGWMTGDKCKAIIQDGRLIEVRPIPLNERQVY